MMKFLAVASMVALTSVPVVGAAQGFNPNTITSGLSFSMRPGVRDVATGCALAAMASGGYTDWGSDSLVKYCIDVAKGLQYSDYQPDRDIE